MADIVFILGAGASADSKVPLCDSFLDQAEEILRSSPRLVDAEAFRLVMDARNTLSQVHSKANIGIKNMEDVFSALEMAGTINRLGDWPEKKIADLPRAMRKVIAQTIENSQEYEWRGGQLKPPTAYKEFIDLLKALTESPEPHRRSVAVISFNYDLGFEVAAYWSSLEFTYCLTQEASRGIPYLKLHGSLNWLEDQSPDNGSKILEWNIGDALKRSLPDPRPATDGPIRLCFGRHLNVVSSQLGIPPTDVPFLVPPTWGKVGHHRRIKGVWSRAAEEMAGARDIHVIGFSLPASDTFFKLFYALGSAGGDALRRFCVHNPDLKSVESKFRDLLGPGASERAEFFDALFQKSQISVVGNLRKIYRDAWNTREKMH